jgi:hypothetical protein
MNPANNIAKNVFFMIELPGWCGNLPRGFAYPTDGPDNLHDPYQVLARAALRGITQVSESDRHRYRSLNGSGVTAMTGNVARGPS